MNDKPAKPRLTDKEARLAERLRENLRRRKAPAPASAPKSPDAS